VEGVTGKFGAGGQNRIDYKTWDVNKALVFEITTSVRNGPVTAIEIGRVTSSLAADPLACRFCLAARSSGGVLRSAGVRFAGLLRGYFQDQNLALLRSGWRVTRHP
jgi:hypothetical protein